jgi:hypothetical protein
MQPAILLIGLAVVWNGLLIAWVLRYYDPDEFAVSPEQRILGDEYDEHYETNAAPSADD